MRATDGLCRLRGFPLAVPWPHHLRLHRELCCDVQREQQLLHGHDADSPRLPAVAGDASQHHQAGGSDASRVLWPVAGDVELQKTEGL